MNLLLLPTMVGVLSSAIVYFTGFALPLSALVAPLFLALYPWLLAALKSSIGWAIAGFFVWALVGILLYLPRPL